MQPVQVYGDVLAQVFRRISDARFQCHADLRHEMAWPETEWCTESGGGERSLQVIFHCTTGYPCFRGCDGGSDEGVKAEGAGRVAVCIACIVACCVCTAAFCLCSGELAEAVPIERGVGVPLVVHLIIYVTGGMLFGGDSLVGAGQYQ